MKKIFYTLAIVATFFAGLHFDIDVVQPNIHLQVALAQFSDQETEKKEVVDTEESQEQQQKLLTTYDQKEGYLACGEFEFGCKMVNFLYWIFIIGGNFLVGISATIMDFFLNHSLQSTSYSGSRVIQQGWEILRDATNILFIFALLMSAFRMVLGQGSSGAKGQVLKIILVALTINFSLYLSFAVIDAGNILGQVFYNKIEKTDNAYTSLTRELPDVQTDDKSFSVSIANKINPQRLFLDETVGGKENKAQRVLIIIMGAIINFTLIGTFLSVSFLFLGRTIGLWFSAILSGLAFASLTIPQLTKQKYFGFNNWLSSLLSASFMAPVFLFFLYIAVTFMNIGIGVKSGTDIVTRIIAIIIPMIFIVILIKTAKEVAESMAGDFAGQVSAMVTKVAGGALAVTGMAATAGLTATAGGVGQIMKSATKKSTSGTGKFLNRMGNSMTRVKSLDVSKIPGFKQVIPKSMTGMAAAVGGKSWRGTTDKAVEKRLDFRDFRSGRKLAEDEKERQDKLDKRKKESTKGADGLYGWERKLQQEADKQRQDKLVEEAKYRKDNNGNEIGFGNDPTIKTAQKKEKDAYRNVLDNQSEVEAEKKAIQQLTKSVEQNTQALATANATGGVMQVTNAENNLGVAKIKLAARKEGVELNDSQAQNLLNNKGGSTSFLQGSSKSDFSGYGGNESASNHQSVYEKARKEVNSLESANIQNQISDLRTEANRKMAEASTKTNESEKNKLEREAAEINKDATLLAKKQKEILTNSEAADKKGNFDKNDKK